VSVDASTANPPHIQVTTSWPTYGMAENRFVITVAAQKDIWPHGSTYPINAAAITSNNRIIPIDQVICIEKEP